MLTALLSFPQGTPNNALAVARWRVYFLRRGFESLRQSQPVDSEKFADYKWRLASAEAELERLESSRLAFA
jgi:hypothetical protein